MRTGCRAQGYPRDHTPDLVTGVAEPSPRPAHLLHEGPVARIVLQVREVRIGRRVRGDAQARLERPLEPANRLVGD